MAETIRDFGKSFAVAETILDFGKSFAFKKGFKVGRENWADDDSVTHCGACSAEFGALLRKHHCRACGNIYCWSCSSGRIGYTACTRTSEPGYTEKRKRVCRDCFLGITEMRGRPRAPPEREAYCCHDEPGAPGLALYTPQRSRDALPEILAEKETMVLDMKFDIVLKRLDLAPGGSGNERLLGA